MVENVVVQLFEALQIVVKVAHLHEPSQSTAVRWRVCSGNDV